MMEKDMKYRINVLNGVIIIRFESGPGKALTVDDLRSFMNESLIDEGHLRDCVAVVVDLSDEGVHLGEELQSMLLHLYRKGRRFFPGKKVWLIFGHNRQAEDRLYVHRLVTLFDLAEEGQNAEEVALILYNKEQQEK